MKRNAGLLVAATLASGCLDLASLTAGNGKDAAVANDLAIQFPDGSTCNNGIKDGVETDIDCGGPMCPACQIGKMCLAQSDCQSAECVNNVCAAPQGDAAVIDMAVPSEVDMTTGGDMEAGGDMAMIAASCMDGKKNAQESDIDCGGPKCPKCKGGKMCGGGGDCTSGKCSAGLCVGLTLGFKQSWTFVRQDNLIDVDFLLADLKHNGVLDIVTAPGDGQTKSMLAVYLGGGDGTFGAEVDYKGEAQFLFAADMDGDGKLDIASAGGPNGTFNYFKGKGDGTLLPGAALWKSPYQGDAMIGVLIGDLRGHGMPDAVVSHSSINNQVGTLFISLAQGAGNYAAPAEYSINGSSSNYIATADFNGDGKLDVVASSPAIRVGLGNGDGTFRPVIPIVESPVFTNFIVDDLNGDGFPDLANGESDAGNHKTALAVRFGKGDGTMGNPTYYDFPQTPMSALSIAAIDLDLDGYLDLIIEGFPGSAISYLGNPDGTFRTGPNINTGPNSTGITIRVGDLNRDGKPDFVSLSSTYTLTAYLNVSN